MFKISVQELKPALTNVLGTIRKTEDMPTIAQARIVSDGERVTVTATDRFIAFEQVLYERKGDKDPFDLDPFELNISLEALELINKLPKGRSLEIDGGGVRAGKITFSPSDEDYPNVQSLIDNAWDNEQWNALERKFLAGYNPQLVKHIKDVKIIPHPQGAGRARLQAPRLKGVIIGVKIDGK